MSLLVARDLTVSATLDGVAVPVLQGLDFAVAPGEILGLVGESGAGKSMVGRAIARMLPAGFSVTGGSLTFAGRDLVGMPAAERRSLLGKDIAFIPQEPLSALNPVLTIGHQIDEHLSRLRVGPARVRRERALALFDAVHLPRGGDLLRLYPHQISGGMCQRVLIAMAFASDPRLVIADEPTTALDVTLQARIVQLIADMQRRADTAIVFITHDLRLAAQICDRILVLYAGRVAEHGPARRLFATPAHPYTRCLQLASPPMSGPRRVLQSLPEQMPGLRAWKDIVGCAFALRCPNAIADCTRAPRRSPTLRQIIRSHVCVPKPHRQSRRRRGCRPIGWAQVCRFSTWRGSGRHFRPADACFDGRRFRLYATLVSRWARANSSGLLAKAAAEKRPWRVFWSGLSNLRRAPSTSSVVRSCITWPKASQPGKAACR